MAGTGTDLRWEAGRWACLPGYLDAVVCDAIIDVCDRLEARAADVVSGGGMHGVNEVRVCHVRRVPRIEATATVYSLAWRLGSVLNERNFELDLTGIEKDPEFVTYVADAGHFDWHNDLGLERPTSRRKLTLSIQLSHTDDYVGGDFEIFGTPEPMARERGTVLALPSYIHHRVTPVTAGCRHALLAWIAGPALR